jgi:hypothetical protein
VLFTASCSDHWLRQWPVQAAKQQTVQQRSWSVMLAAAGTGTVAASGAAAQLRSHTCNSWRSWCGSSWRSWYGSNSTDMRSWCSSAVVRSYLQQQVWTSFAHADAAAAVCKGQVADLGKGLVMFRASAVVVKRQNGANSGSPRLALLCSPSSGDSGAAL